MQVISHRIAESLNNLQIRLAIQISKADFAVDLSSRMDSHPGDMSDTESTAPPSTRGGREPDRKRQARSGPDSEDLGSLFAELELRSSAKLDRMSEGIAAITGTCNEMVGGLRGDFCGLVQKLDDKYLHRISEVERFCQDIDERLRALETSVKKEHVALSSLHRVVAVAENATPIQEEINLADFNRIALTNVVRVRTNEPVNFTVVEVLVKLLMAEASIEADQYKLSGIKLGRFFDINLTGEERLAARRTAKVLQLIRFDEKWRGLEVALPDSPRKSPIYFDQDKNRATIRREILSKRLATIIKELKPSEDIKSKRAEGVVEINRCPIAKMVLSDPVEFRIVWNLNKVAELNIEKAAVRAKLELGAPSSSAAVSWG